MKQKHINKIFKHILAKGERDEVARVLLTPIANTSYPLIGDEQVQITHSQMSCIDFKFIGDQLYCFYTDVERWARVAPVEFITELKDNYKLEALL